MINDRGAFFHYGPCWPFNTDGAAFGHRNEDAFTAERDQGLHHSYEW